MSEDEPETTKPAPVIPYASPQQNGPSLGSQILAGIGMFILWIVVTIMGVGMLASLPLMGIFPPFPLIFIIGTLVFLVIWVRRRKRDGWRAIVPVMLAIFGLAILGFGTCAAYVISQMR